MAKGVFTIEFDGIADLIQQLRLLTAGAALLDIEAPVVVSRTTADTPKATESAWLGMPADPLNYPTAKTEERPQTVRGAQGKLGDGKTFQKERPTPEELAAEHAENERRLEHAAQTGTTFVPVGQESAKDTAGAAVKQQPPEKSEAAKVDVTLENLSGAPYEALLAFCEQNPGVGINVKMSQPTYFRKTVEHRIKAFLTTPAS